jgi:putative flippase GtrA
MRQPEKAGDPSHAIKQFRSFLIVGLSNFALSFAVFFLLYNYWQLSGPFYRLLGEAGRSLEDLLLQFGAGSLDATLANIIGYGAGILNSFAWNKFWTFKARHGTGSQFLRFMMLNVSCLLLSSASLFFFTDYLNLPYLQVWFMTMGIVTLINFGVSKYWVFRVIEDCSANETADD